MYTTDSGFVAILKGDGLKCSKIAFKTNEETLVRTALLKLGLKKEDYELKKVEKTDWEKN